MTKDKTNTRNAALARFLAASAALRRASDAELDHLHGLETLAWHEFCAFEPATATEYAEYTLIASLLMCGLESVWRDAIIANARPFVSPAVAAWMDEQEAA